MDEKNKYWRLAHLRSLKLQDLTKQIEQEKVLEKRQELEHQRIRLQAKLLAPFL